jgi:uncharacterized protein YfiM (DUF2279 family)
MALFLVYAVLHFHWWVHLVWTCDWSCTSGSTPAILNTGQDKGYASCKIGIWMLSTGHIKHAQNKTMSHERWHQFDLLSVQVYGANGDLWKVPYKGFSFSDLWRHVVAATLYNYWLLMRSTHDLVNDWLTEANGRGESIIDQVRIVMSRLKLQVNNCFIK